MTEHLTLRKHSSGDLHSRLKTRRILGVDQTDNGDIHRSKISQLLGHNEHLHVRFPKFYSTFYIFLASYLCVVGALNLLTPRMRIGITFTSTADQLYDGDVILKRFYGSSILGLGATFLAFYGTNNKQEARSFMLVAFFLYVTRLLITGSNIGFLWSSNKLELILTTLVESTICGTCCWFYRTIGSSTSGIRRSVSLKDLQDLNSQ